MDEGVVKYEVEHSSVNAPYFTAYTTIEPIRSHLFALGFIGEHHGVGYGNISVRDTATTGFFITATQTGKLSTLHREHYSYIHHYDFHHFLVQSQGVFPPSSEALSHAMIYEIHPDIRAVIHIHSSVLWHFMQTHDYLATHAAYGTKAMVDDIAHLYRHCDPFLHNAFVMRGHQDGIITFGRTLDDAQISLYHILKCYLSQV